MLPDYRIFMMSDLKAHGVDSVEISRRYQQTAIKVVRGGNAPLRISVNDLGLKLKSPVMQRKRYLFKSTNVDYFMVETDRDVYFDIAAINGGDPGTLAVVTPFICIYSIESRIGNVLRVLNDTFLRLSQEESEINLLAAISGMADLILSIGGSERWASGNVVRPFREIVTESLGEQLKPFLGWEGEVEEIVSGRRVFLARRYWRQWFD